MREFSRINSHQGRLPSELKEADNLYVDKAHLLSFLLICGSHRDDGSSVYVRAIISFPDETHILLLTVTCHNPSAEISQNISYELKHRICQMCGSAERVMSELKKKNLEDNALY